MMGAPIKSPTEFMHGVKNGDRQRCPHGDRGGAFLPVLWRLGTEKSVPIFRELS